MQVNELRELAAWINNSFADTEIIGKYNALVGVITNNNRQNTPKKPFVNEKSILSDAILKLSLIGLNNGQIRVLESLGIKNNVSVQGKKKFDSVFTANASDFVTILNELKIILTSMKAAQSWAKTIVPSVDLAFPKMDADLPLNNVSIRLTFKGEASLDNFADVEKWSKHWMTITRGVAMSESAAPEDFKIVGASTGSVSFFVVTTVFLARGLAWTVKEVMDRVEQLDRIRLQKEELKKSKFDTQAAQDALTGIEESEKGKLAEAIILAKFGVQKEDDKSGDIRTAFGHSADLLLEFLSADGEIEFKLPQINTEGDTVDEDYLEAFDQLDQLNNNIIQARLNDKEIINLPSPSNSESGDPLES